MVLNFRLKKNGGEGREAVNISFEASFGKKKKKRQRKKKKMMSLQKKKKCVLEVTLDAGVSDFETVDGLARSQVRQTE